MHFAEINNKKVILENKHDNIKSEFKYIHYDYHRLVQMLEFVKLIHGILYYLYSRDSLETYSCVSFQRDVEPILQSGPQ